MCGIAGIFDLRHRPASLAMLKKMLRSISHRGPDDEGVYTDRFLGLGHRRLSIIDLSKAGHQPMADQSGRFVLTYNGEIYNFQELRIELEALGHKFRSKTDTEVVLYALIEWGAKALERFNGMFALALWDKTKEELLLARDRYGIKPLYTYQHDSLFLFGSEVKAILAHSSVRPEMDKEALLEYMTFQNFFTDKTLFKGVSLFPQGSYALLRKNGEGPKIYQYWDFCFKSEERDRGEESYIEELDYLIRQAVNRQLVGDVEIGSYLSGGMDSGSVTALAASQLPYIKTFTVGFDLKSASGIELTFDEREKAEFMSYLFKTEHYEMVLKSGDMERIMPELTYHLEEPRVGQCYPNFYAAKLASKFCKVVLCGTG